MDLRGGSKQSGMAKRKLENWLESYLEWTLPRSEAPASLILWSGLFAMSSVIKRNVYWSKSLMGSYSIYPNLYILFVGPPGVIRKSTTAGYAEDLIADLKANSLGEAQVNLTPEAISSSDLIRVLSESPDGSLSILSSEFGTFMATSAEKMYDMLTDLFDGKRKFDYSTRAHGPELANKPCVNLLGCTTPSWMAEQPTYVTGGGFARRVIFLFENEVRQRHLYYTHLDWNKLDTIGANLREDLTKIARVKGPIRHDSPSTMHLMEQWYQTNARTQANRDGRVEGYHQTKHVHVHKLCILLSLAESDSLVVTRRHFERALEILGEAEKKMPKALASTGRNPYSSHLEQVEEFLANQNKAVPRRVLLSRFYHDLSATELDGIMSALVAMGKVKFIKGEKPGEGMYRKL